MPKHPHVKPTRPLGSFFTHGSIKILSEERELRQAQLSIVMPACVMQAITPLLLGAGLIDQYELRKPLAAWIPMIADEGFHQNSDPDFPIRINAAIRQSAEEALNLFNSMQSYLKFPADAIPMLPIGIYVKFKFRCDIDKLGPLLEKMGGAAGVHEFRFALAEILASVIVSWRMGL